jgi:hypothetical protein
MVRTSNERCCLEIYQMFSKIWAGFAVAGSLIAAIGACSPSSTSQTPVACGTPSTTPPPPPAWLAYPPSGSTSVPTTIGRIIEKGAQNSIQLALTGPNGNVPLGAPTSAPSPYPSPFATAPASYPSSEPYLQVAVPTLSPNTTYAVSDLYPSWANNPPQCSVNSTQSVGTFTTGT